MRLKTIKALLRKLSENCVIRRTNRRLGLCQNHTSERSAIRKEAGSRIPYYLNDPDDDFKIKSVKFPHAGLTRMDSMPTVSQRDCTKSYGYLGRLFKIRTIQ